MSKSSLETRPDTADPKRARLGISSCLLGEKVRYDGGHKRDPFLTDLLGRYVEWVPVCPEVEMGLGVPRETLRLAKKEGRLHDPPLRENFVSLVFSYRRWMALERSGSRAASVTRFHAQHKFLLVAHSQDGARRLGRIAAQGGEYFAEFVRVMRCTPTRKNHTNVLQHMAGYFSDSLSASDRAELVEVIDGYRRALVPLIVPVTLIRHYVRKYDVPYLRDQVYLNPHPHELLLLNQL